MKSNFHNIINGPLPVLIDFHAEWCGPCKAQSPIIQDVAKSSRDRLRVIKIDIDKNPRLAEQYQIRAVPTLALFKDGQLLWSQAGMMSKQQILDIVRQKV